MTFGDHDDDDTYDASGQPADPEQVARKLHELEGGRWDDLTPTQRAGRVAILVALLAWLRRHGHRV